MYSLSTKHSCPVSQILVEWTTRLKDVRKETLLLPPYFQKLKIKEFDVSILVLNLA